jgi:hypothetical protein
MAGVGCEGGYMSVVGDVESHVVLSWWLVFLKSCCRFPCLMFVTDVFYDVLLIFFVVGLFFIFCFGEATLLPLVWFCVQLCCYLLKYKTVAIHGHHSIVYILLTRNGMTDIRMKIYCTKFTHSTRNVRLTWGRPIQIQLWYDGELHT